MAAITLARLVLAAVIPLTEDEAYYRLWASSLQFGYYDHPPMIAWWIRAGMTLAGDRPLGVRLLPALSSGLTSLLVFDLAQRLGASAKAGERAAIWFNATLLIGAGGFLATPDSASTPFWVFDALGVGQVRTRRRGALVAGGGRLRRAGGHQQIFSPLPRPRRADLAGAAAQGPARASDPLALARRPDRRGDFRDQCGMERHAPLGGVRQTVRPRRPGRLAPQFLLELIAGQILLLNPPIAWFAGAACGTGASARAAT